MAIALAESDYREIVRRITSLEQHRDRSAAAVRAAGTIGNVDIAATAGITVSKLYGGGTANRIVRTTDGVNMVMGQLQTADMAVNTVHATPTAVNHSGGSVVASGGGQTVPGSTLGLTTSAQHLSVQVEMMTRFSCTVSGTIVTVYFGINGGAALEIGAMTCETGWYNTATATTNFVLAANTGYSFSIIFTANAGTVTFANGWTRLKESKV